MELLFSLGLPVLLVMVVWLFQWLRVLAEYERGIVFRLGRVRPNAVGPGLTLLLFPGIVDKLVKVDLRTVTLEVPSQDVITKDNVSIKVNAVVYYRVVDPQKAVLDIENYSYATLQMGQTSLRSIVGQFDLDEFLSQRNKISDEMQLVLDHQTEGWGVKVTNVEIKNVDLPPDMQRAMARQAEAERERRSKIINAEGEYQAAEKLTQAAAMMSKEPMALQMRYMQTMVEVGAEKNSTIFFPVPIDMISAFLKK